ncbi:hypothetical protein [Geomonas silvestris]|nr:hypothetical protein [Geomonas silvestris]
MFVRRFLTLSVLALCAGCASVNGWWQGRGAHREPEKKSQPAELKQPAQGEPAGPPKAVKKAPAGKTGTATADQVLFRRALLALKPSRETVVSKRGRQLLTRLKREYPASPWSAEAAPILELIEIADELSRENRELKATNDSLSAEVEELNGNIEKMKRLDMELEKAR